MFERFIYVHGDYVCQAEHDCSTTDEPHHVDYIESDGDGNAAVTIAWKMMPKETE